MTGPQYRLRTARERVEEDVQRFFARNPEARQLAIRAHAAVRLDRQAEQSGDRC